MFTLMFWKATFERGLSTAAQTAAALVSAAGLGLLDVAWAMVGQVSGLSAVYAVLKALAAARSGSSGPGFGSAEVLADPDAPPVTPERRQSINMPADGWVPRTVEFGGKPIRVVPGATLDGVSTDPPE